MSATNSCELIGRVAGEGLRTGTFTLRVAGGRQACSVDVLSATRPPEGALVAVRAHVTADAAGAYFQAKDLDILAKPPDGKVPGAKPRDTAAGEKHR